MAQREDKIIKKADILIGILLLLASLLLLLLFQKTVYDGQVQSVIVEVDGERYAEYKISDPAFCETLEIFSKNGYNKLEIKDGMVWMSDADCPDGFDVKQGPISKPNQTIVCLPNRVFVRLTGRSDADAVSY